MVVMGAFLTFVPPFFLGPIIFIAGLYVGTRGMFATAVTGVKLTKFASSAITARNSPNDGSGVKPDYPGQHDNRATPTNLTVAAPIPAKTASYDEKKWEVLLQVDNEIAQAADKLRPFGERYVDELAETFMTLNDKSYLPAIVLKIADKAQLDIKEKEAQQAKLSLELATTAERKRTFAQAARGEIATNGGIDNVTGKRVASVSIYEGEAKNWVGALKVVFGDGDIELRESAEKRMFFSGEKEFAVREARNR